jgi:hypothetical protein
MMGDILAECRHGLTMDWCAICKNENRTRAGTKNGAAWRHATGPRLVEPHGPHTTAQFSSSCPWCGDDIREGEDEVYLRAGDWLCVSCTRIEDERSSGG